MVDREEGADDMMGEWGGEDREHGAAPEDHNTGHSSHPSTHSPRCTRSERSESAPVLWSWYHWWSYSIFLPVSVTLDVFCWTNSNPDDWQGDLGRKFLRNGLDPDWSLSVAQVQGRHTSGSMLVHLKYERSPHWAWLMWIKWIIKLYN